MTVLEHLTELRKRLIISLAAITVMALVGFAFFGPIFEALLRPYRIALANLPEAARPEGVLGAGSLVYSSPVDPFLIRVKVAFFTGLLLALPVVLFQVWRFVTPGLTKRERRLAIPFVLVSVLLFAGGVAFAYVTIPRGLSFLLSLGGESLVPLLTVDRYFSFFVFLTLGFGLSFEFPLILVFLAIAGVVTTSQMRGWRRYAYFGALVFAAVITPTQDPYTMLLMWLPLVLFYEGAILVARLLKR